LVEVETAPISSRVTDKELQTSTRCFCKTCADVDVYSFHLYSRKIFTLVIVAISRFRFHLQVHGVRKRLRLCLQQLPCALMDFGKFVPPKLVPYLLLLISNNNSTKVVPVPVVTFKKIVLALGCVSPFNKSYRKSK
jgi:hypothetical protein